MLKHAHREFPSDAFVVLATVGARLDIVDGQGAELRVDLEQFLRTDMNGRIVTGVEFPALSSDHVVRTFKVMPRSSNAHAYVNAGFCARVDRGHAHRIVDTPTIVFGGISSSFVRPHLPFLI